MSVLLSLGLSCPVRALHPNSFEDPRGGVKVSHVPSEVSTELQGFTEESPKSPKDSRRNLERHQGSPRTEELNIYGFQTKADGLYGGSHEPLWGVPVPSWDLQRPLESAPELSGAP